MKTRHIVLQFIILLAVAILASVKYESPVIKKSEQVAAEEESIAISKPNSKEIWKDLTIESKIIEDIVNDKFCYGTQTAFIACVNGLNNALETTFDLKLNQKDKTEKIGKAITEKQELEKWVPLYNSKSKISFTKHFQWLKDNLDDSNRNYNLSLVLNGFLSVYEDPHTYLIPYKKYLGFIENSDRSSGFFLGKSKSNGQYYFKSVHKDSKIYEAGVRVGDQLIAVNDEFIKDVPSADIGDKFVDGKPISIKVLGKKGMFDYKLENLFGPNPATYHEILEDKVGYVSLRRFYKNTCSDLMEIAVEFNQKQVDHMILDMRDNGGGPMDVAICAAKVFLDKKDLIVKTASFSEEENDEIEINDEDPLYKGKVYVLINSKSASSSEILAGALKDHARALVIGQASFGKGTFQECNLWGHNKEIVLCRTQGYYLNPSGQSPQVLGITPHIEVESDNLLQLREKDIYFKPVAEFRDQFYLNRKVKVKKMNNKKLDDPELMSTLMLIKDSVDVISFLEDK